MKIKGTLEIPVEINIRKDENNITELEYPSNIDERIEKSVLKILEENNFKTNDKIGKWYNFAFPCAFFKR